MFAWSGSKFYANVVWKQWLSPWQWLVDRDWAIASRRHWYRICSRSRKHPAASYFVVSTSHCHRKQQRVRFRVVITSAFILANEFLDEWTSGNFAIHRKNLPSSDLLCCSLKVFSRTGMDAAGWAYRRTETWNLLLLCCCIIGCGCFSRHLAASTWLSSLDATREKFFSDDCDGPSSQSSLKKCCFRRLLPMTDLSHAGAPVLWPGGASVASFAATERQLAAVASRRPLLPKPVASFYQRNYHLLCGKRRW